MLRSFTLSLAGRQMRPLVYQAFQIGAGLGTGTLFSDVIGTDANQSVIGSMPPQYIYKDFQIKYKCFY